MLFRSDGAACVRRVIARQVGRWIEVAPGFRARFWDAGHILGSASIELAVEDGAGASQTLLFSGDIGPGGKAIQGPPTAPSGVDYLFAESTYGDRIKPRVSDTARRNSLRAEIKAGLRAGGLILIPAFAVERTQELLVDLDWLFDQIGRAHV